MTHDWHSTNLLVSDMTCLVGRRWISNSIINRIAQIINETAKDIHAIHLNLLPQIDSSAKETPALKVLWRCCVIL